MMASAFGDGSLIRDTLKWFFSVVLVLGWIAPTSAQTVPSGFANSLVMNGWQEPVGFTFDANGRWYVWEKRGRVWIVENGVRRSQPLIDISAEVGNWRDHGCLGFALDPSFLSNGRIYLMYTVDRHHLMNQGTGSYSATTDQYFAATIMRITRYTAIGPSFNTADVNSRVVLVGETRQTGVPLLHESHSTGQLVFGTDGTLLATVGDGASYNNVDVGNDAGTYYAQALTDGIIRPAENVGAMRSQLLNCHNGKLLRIDPNTGDGVPSNPFYDASAPRSPKSRVWALGLRNPYRMTLRPGTGSIDPALGDPGSFYIGDVGWGTWEDLNVCYEGGMNFGWPLFEGMEAHAGYTAANTANLDAPNPLFGQGGCTQQYFNFQDLLKQDRPDHLNAHPNPCNSAVQVPVGIPHFIHDRPAIDWQHGNRSRCGGFSGSMAVTYDLDVAGSPVPGPRFGGNAAVGGTWLSGIGWPLGYQNVYFQGDYAGAWIKRFTFNAQDEPLGVANFGSSLGAVVFLKEGPDGALWYVRYETNAIYKISPLGVTNLPPVAAATQSTQYGTGPLLVTFSGAPSSDPENGALSYTWNFGDGGTASGMNTSHVFTATPGVPTGYTVTLTVTDPQGAANSTQMLVSVNNTPPVVQITSFPNAHRYPLGIDTTYALVANVTDAQHSAAQLSYQWRTILHHNAHIHPESATTTPTGTTVVSGEGCYTDDFSYEVELKVTDAGGLATTVVHWLYPRCSALPPTAWMNSSVNFGEGPLNVVLDGSGSSDNRPLVGYAWDFGDGSSATGMSVNRTFTEPGDYLVTLTVTDEDGLMAYATKVISVIGHEVPQCVGSAGSVLRQYWSNVNGSLITDLTSATGYPASPSGTSYPTSFQAPIDFANSYGTRIRGYIIAPSTGNYVFTTVSDDASEVYLSLNADPLFKRSICVVPGWTNVGEFTKYASQTSVTIPLVAGRYYYVEALHKEGSGGDHFALYWQTPTNNTRTIIPGSALARWQDCSPSVVLKAELQGPFSASNNLMRDDLRAAGMIPTLEPFTASGFTHVGGGGGETITPSLLSGTGMNAVVDWVLIELRNKNTPANIVATRSALIQRDGDVVGTNGSTRIMFNVPNDNYYVALRHRNHLGIMTASSQVLNASPTSIDLSNPGTLVYGSGSRVALSAVRHGMWCGNVQRDGQIKYSGTGNDRDPILLVIGGMTPNSQVVGYSMGDVDLNGLVKYTGSGNDRDIILLNVGSTTPNNVRTEQLP